MLNLDKAQERQAKERRERAEKAIDVRLGETYRWLLVPRQGIEPGAPVEFVEQKLEGSSGLAVRASDRLVREGSLYTEYPAVLLRTLLDGVLAPEWKDGHVTVGRLWEVFSQYPYLPKLRDRRVLETAVSNGPASTVWQVEGFAVADLMGADGRYRGLTTGAFASVLNADTLAVRPARALAQLEADAALPQRRAGSGGHGARSGR